ncbi:MAG: hypothetical protein AAF806_01415 [Bacteroidota bacterium]
MNLAILNKATEVEITKAEFKRAQAFAEAVISTVNYSDSNQKNKAKIQEDHFVSKLGEEAVRKIYERANFQVKGPDYEIYKGKKKSWEEDLYIDDIGMAVKTQKRSAANRYGLSWTFQCSEKRKDPVLKDPLAWVCFVVFEDIGSKNCLVYPAKQIGILKFRPPKLKYLIGKKQVVYAEDFK